MQRIFEVCFCVETILEHGTAGGIGHSGEFRKAKGGVRIPHCLAASESLTVLHR